MKTSTKAIIISSVSAVALLALAIFIYFKFCFVYNEGTDAGELNYFSRRGVIFKTYEGKMIQSGFKSKAGGQTGVQSNEFKFSVVNPRVADSLMHCTGRQMMLHYQEYNATLPWRGESVFVVDSIWSME